ncbi:hypothetical protein [Nonomuraea sp. NPDC049709]|uniref:hypothetical protein n=1 Tax=Nonomuraea sp. NPDC049709 TaxID=3154736 RepID=UPI003425789D
MTVQDLRDVLRERAEGPSPANPRRHDQVRARIRRTRLRRRAAAGTALVAAVAAGMVLLPGTAAPPARETTTAARLAPTATAKELPLRFTAPDGTEYRRLATAALEADGAKKTSVTIPVSGRPLDVAALCDGEFGASAPKILVDGNHTGPRGFTSCPNAMELQPLVVPPGATRVTVTFDTTTTGWGCVVKKKGGPCVRVPEKRAGWDLAVYEWTPPSRPVTPEPVKAFPDRAGGRRLASMSTGVYPNDSTIELEVVSTGGRIGIDQLCSGDLAARMWFTYRVNGGQSPSTVMCGVWKEGPYPMAMSEFEVPKGKKVTITGRMGLWGEHTNRPVDWAVAVYRN